MSFTKIRHKFIKYEECRERVKYSITLNPDDLYQHWEPTINLTRREAFENDNIKWLRKLSTHDGNNVFQMELHLEISPLGRLHYHGTLVIINKDLFYFYTLHKLQSRFVYEIDTINDPEIWEQYCIKQDFKPVHCIGFNFKTLKNNDFFTRYTETKEQTDG